MSKVWVVQEGRNDYSAAEDFGEVEFITRSDLRPMAGSRQNAEVINDIKRFRSLYVPGVDYIVPVGNLMVVTLVIMALGPMEHRFLKWDGRRAIYIPYNLSERMVK